MYNKFFDEECVKRVNEISSLVSDENCEEISKDLTDGIGSILANAAITITEQKRLLQQAKTPSALVSAIKALTVTSANLFNAGAGMLSWMGKKLPRRDSIDDMKSLMQMKDEHNTYEILRDSSDKFVLACNPNKETGLCGSIQDGFTTVDDALQALYKALKKESN